MMIGLRVTLGQHSQAGARAHGRFRSNPRGTATPEGEGARDRVGAGAVNHVIQVNQDHHGAMLPSEPLRSSKGIVVAQADGIGSSAVSQDASAAAVSGFLDDYYATSDAWSVRRSAHRVLAATNAWLHAQTMRSDARFDKDLGYVCTFSALILKGREMHLLHVGDTRIYRLHERSWEQLTVDHRVQVSPTESLLGRALGVAPNVEIDYRCMAAEAGEIYLLATDGAYAYLDAAAVHDAVARFPEDFDAAAAALVAQARSRGGDDDATVQLLRIDALPEGTPLHLQVQREQLALPPPLSPRMSFEGYTLVRELHASARSHVHLAMDDATGQAVVLKTPSVDLRDDPHYLDSFLLEEWVARRIHSPHVLKPAPNERPRRHVVIAMEYIDGQTLAQWMTDHPRPALDTVRGIVTQVARGLQAFHGKEMLHQDLRPENVMIDRTGTAKIIDFASTHVAGLNEGTAGARADAIAGTLQYAAPEYFAGSGGSSRSDLFSLAVVTYQMLTGRLPYGLQVPRVRSANDLRRLRYVPVRHLRPELPDWLDGVLQKALHPDPSKRQEAVSEFIHDLRSPGPQFLRRRRPPLVDRHPVAFWQGVALLLALAVVLLLALRVLGR